MNENVKRVEEGVTFTVEVGDPWPPQTFTVGPKCDTNQGGWFCLTHTRQFENNLMKDFHIGGSAEHVLVWICSTHGPEVP